MKRRLLLAAIIPLLAACTVSVIGPKQVLIPDGETVAVTLASGATREGELLAVTGTELILNEQGRLVAVGLPALSKVLVVRYEKTVDGEWTEKLSLFCRYPQGLAEEQWHQLLTGAGQGDFVRPANLLSAPPRVGPVPRVNPNEPWTGKWKVSSGRNPGIWSLTQNGDTVISTSDSDFKLAAKVHGAVIRGKWSAKGGNDRDLQATIAEDGLSFNGAADYSAMRDYFTAKKIE
jgi:hypothetical protein